MNPQIICLLCLLPVAGAASADEQIFSPGAITTDIISIIVVFIASIATTIGGIGGGGIFVPLIMLANGFDLNETIPLSVATIFGSGLVRMLYYYNKPHPTVPGRTLVHHLPLLVIDPSGANFSFIGLILLDLLPDAITLAVIVITLGYVFVKTLRNGIKKLKLEKRNGAGSSMKYELAEIDGIDIGQFDLSMYDQLLLGLPDPCRPNHPAPYIFNCKKSTRSDNLRKNIAMTAMVMLVIVLVTIFSVLRANYNLCDEQFLVLGVLQLVVVGMASAGIYVFFVRRELRTRRDNNYPATESDIVFTNKAVAKLVLVSSITGIVATYIGIGGSMVIVPVMIGLGIAPNVVVATASISTFFTSLISLANYLAGSKLIWQYAIAYIISSGLGTVVGIYISKKFIMQKYQSYIIFMVAVLIAGSMALLVVNSLVLRDIDIAHISFGDPCDN